MFALSSRVFTGNTGIRPLSTTPFAEILRQNGYSTAAFGKYHETPPWEISVSGSFDRWPTHSGFDKFYGFIGGETNQYAPLLFDGTAQVEQSSDPKYHLTTDLTDHAISWMRAQHALTPDIEMIPIQKINEAYERLVKSDVKYRFCIDMASLKAE